ncbi:35818_t:CDS:2, partial [Gigaspora margarita]
MEQHIEFLTYFVCSLKLNVGIAFDDGVNEKPTSSTFDTTEIFKEVEEKRPKQKRGDKNDAVLYQDDSAHYFGDIIKLARNGIDDVIHYFVQYPTSSITTAKKIKIYRNTRALLEEGQSVE